MNCYIICSCFKCKLMHVELKLLACHQSMCVGNERYCMQLPARTDSDHVQGITDAVVMRMIFSAYHILRPGSIALHCKRWRHRL